MEEELHNDVAVLLEAPYSQEGHVSKIIPRRSKKPYANGSLEWMALKTMQQEKSLHVATSVNDTEKVSMLLKQGVHPTCKDQLFRTPLHIAASKGYIDVIRLLLSHGGNVNATDSIGNTPLHLAICTSHVEVVTELIKAGSDVKNLDRYGKSPLQMAYAKLRLLEKYLHSSRGVELKQELTKIIDMMKAYSQAADKKDEDDLLQSLSSLVLSEGCEKESFQLKLNKVMEKVSLLDV